MCNIAGYVGTKRAAPILIEMLRRQEGFDAGFYSGIATIHEGKIYYTKLADNLDRLVELTDAMDLPGTVGIIHSRTKSGGDDAWAHPFVDMRENGPSIAYVANGSAGIFSDRTEEYSRKADSLISEGYGMYSKGVLDKKRYNTLADGTSVHMSDVMCQLIAKHIDMGKEPMYAMGDAFCEMPSEIVGLMLSLKSPDSVVYSRINAPMNVAFAEHGAYLASAALVFPKDAGQPHFLPVCTSGCVYKDRLVTVPFSDRNLPVHEITADVKVAVYNTVIKALENGGQTMSTLRKAITEAKIFGEGKCGQSGILIYDTLRSLLMQGRLSEEIKRIPGVKEGSDAPRVFFGLNN